MAAPAEDMTGSENDWFVRRLRRTDVPSAKALILAGLAEHWGWLDPDLNLDLEELWEIYGPDRFLVADYQGRIVGTGALELETPAVARIVRMSVSRDMRRLGIGRAILRALTRLAYGAGVKKIVLETTASWIDVIAFYERCGFQLYASDTGEANFFLDLADQRQTVE